MVGLTMTTDDGAGSRYIGTYLDNTDTDTASWGAEGAAEAAAKVDVEAALLSVMQAPTFADFARACAIPGEDANSQPTGDEADSQLTQLTPQTPDSQPTPRSRSPNSPVSSQLGD